MAKACFLMCPNDAAGIEEMKDKPSGVEQLMWGKSGEAYRRIGGASFWVSGSGNQSDPNNQIDRMHGA